MLLNIGKLRKNQKTLVLAVGAFAAVAALLAASIAVDEALPENKSEMPSLVPKDFPTYPGAEIIRIETLPPTNLAIGFASNDSPQQVFGYLVGEAEKSGWKITERSSRAFRSEKDGTTITVSVSQDTGEQTAILQQIEMT